ncbi:hypothetical protein GINT2_000773 [Glugoides intestinalis]
MKTCFQEFKELFEKTLQEFLEISKLKKEIKTVNTSISLLNGCVSRFSTSQPAYPIIVGNGMSRASITNLGTFPPYKITKGCTYPLNYTVKKRFKPHENYKKSLNNKVLYICTVTNEGITITADDGYLWAGEDLWRTFKIDVGIENEFSSLEDFMSLTNTVVIKMIENIAESSNFKICNSIDKK